MRILVLSPEAGAWIHSTPLGQGINALAESYRDSGAEVRVYSPLYQGRMGPELSICAAQAAVDPIQGEEYQVVHSSDSLHWYIDHRDYFHRDGVYNDSANIPYGDNHRRYSLLCSAALMDCLKDGWIPDCIHGHEWASAPLMSYVRRQFQPELKDCRLIFTIHNILYDFHFFDDEIGRLGLDRKDFCIDGYEFWGKVSLLKVGILYADHVAFTSEGYSRSVVSTDLPGGLQGFLELQAGKVVGIQNGIDYGFWGKRSGDRKERKLALQGALGLPENPDAFLLYCHLDREAGRTGEILSTILSNLFLLDLQIVVGYAGTRADADYFRRIGEQNGGKLASILLSGDDPQVRNFLAASDAMFLCNPEEPSLSIVLKALAAGAIPVVSSERGFDTLLSPIEQAQEGTVPAFVSPEAWPDQMLRSVKSAIDTYQQDQVFWNKLVQYASSFRRPWKDTAKGYMSLA